jgi:hypothetical protein
MWRKKKSESPGNQYLQIINKLHVDLVALGLNDFSIKEYFNHASLCEMIEAIDSVEGGWYFLRENQYYDPFDTMNKIEAAYSQKSTCKGISGTDYKYLMTNVKKIAKFGVNDFTESIITDVKTNLLSILEKQ